MTGSGRVSRAFAIFVGVSLLCLLALVVLLPRAAAWPAASLEGRQTTCMSCHEESDKWSDPDEVIIDIIDPATGASFRQADGSFLIPVGRGGERRVKSVFGVRPDLEFPPDMVGWLYVDPTELKNAPESGLKFAPGWEVNRPFCGKRLVERVKGFEGDKMAAITMTLRPSAEAGDAELQLQVFFKSLARGMEGSYYQERVLLQVVD